MRYRLLAIDLDGTLLNPQGEVSDANRHALAAAREAGAMVVPCTGRSWREGRLALDGVPGLEWGVFVTGATVAELATGRSVDFACFEPHAAFRLVEALSGAEEAVLVFREHERAGHEYLVTGAGELPENTRWWFELTGAIVHEQPKVTTDDLHDCLRVGMVTNGDRVDALRTHLQASCGDIAHIHSFCGIHDPDAPAHSVHILEAFPLGVDKWRGIRFLADRHGIPHHEVACIGDEINDLSMLEAAGLGVAMDNAIDAAKQHADRITRSNAHDGVAHAIDQMLAGRW